jgi:N-succinyldiaminopimelate aminotransferase
VIDSATFEKLIRLADRHNFVIASDECYSEIYLDDKMRPTGLLQAAAELGRDNYERCLVFNSLSKRSSVPGLRSGFVAGDKTIIDKFRLYRTYHGSAMSPPIQAASTKAWQDEKHVAEMREVYRDKFCFFEQVLSPITEICLPDGGFFLWLQTKVDDKHFARDLYKQYNLSVLPGSFLSRVAHGIDPGHGYVRIALVGTLEECKEAAWRLKDFISGIVKHS